MSVKDITNARSVLGEAFDKSISRPRTLIIVAESVAGPGYAKLRADFEARIRNGRGDEAAVTVQGWRAPDGSLWTKNKQVWVASMKVRIGGFYLITEVERSLDNEGGTLTVLKLKNPKAYLAALDFTKADALDIDTAEAKKSIRKAKRAGRQSIREIL